MKASSRPPLSARRVVSAALGIVVIWITVLTFTTRNPVDLTVALLVVMAEVLVVAVLAGPLLSVIASLVSVVLVNWYLVPPYGTFEIASAENVTALIVFSLVAVVAATLMEVGTRARTRANIAAQQSELLGDVMTIDEPADIEQALDRIRIGLGLDLLVLEEDQAAGRRKQLAVSGTATDRATIEIPAPAGYRLSGQGNELLAPDPDFLASLGSAAVRAYEAEQMQSEARRADELAAIDRSRTALLASVGHDLRTPLASLRVAVDALNDTQSTLDEGDRRTLMTTLAVSTERLDDLITNLLDMSRLQAGAVVAHRVATDVNEVVNAAELSFITDRLVVAVPRTLRAVSADPTLLERVVVNLISNALRYSPPSTPVELAADEDASTVTLTVADRGSGIATEEVEQVFTPFHRVGAQPDGGSGLGLAIVKGFAEAMEMSVALEARPGGGTLARLRMSVWSGP